jgi:hypothetical protein
MDECRRTPRPAFNRYRVYRRDEATGKDAIASEVPSGEAVNAYGGFNLRMGKDISYPRHCGRHPSRTGGETQVEGDDSPAIRIIAHDIFPPAVPAGLQAVYSGEGQKLFVDVIWAPATEADLAGYNVYRRDADSAPAKLNSDLVKSPAYRDNTVASGKTYHYFVSAVDVRGNESALSEEASETVP